MGDLNEGTDQIPNHAVEKTIPREGDFQNTVFLFDDTNRADVTNSTLPLVAWIGGEGSEVVPTSKDFGGLAQ